MKEDGKLEVLLIREASTDRGADAVWGGVRFLSSIKVNIYPESHFVSLFIIYAHTKRSCLSFRKEQDGEEFVI